MGAHDLPGDGVERGQVVLLERDLVRVRVRVRVSSSI